ncbi:hypothetical protein FZC33_02005 [Labrys sp. KNU-23]|uniref:pectate lyase family protein n=1 Tax=Labrys sp. KNU-23 TaxID=2789216 RepID=UPI0011EC9281|nr:hypothetical protein [Labrys sp. KNU-23]QEN85058.1 hypothetical protein FZC33_02005 [Labrys sp. KNU-23]
MSPHSILAATLDEGARAANTALLEAARARAVSLQGALACNSTAQRIPDVIPGYAGQAGTKGGAGGTVVQVRSEADNTPGTKPVDGSLRAAVELGVRSRRPIFITFSPEMQGKTITLRAPLRPGNDTTIDAGCTGIALAADADVALIVLAARRNVIISGLAFRKFPYQGDNKARADGRDFRDCITVSGAVDQLAILHNDFASCGDGAIDITSGAGRAIPRSTGRVTVAFNRFAKHDKAMLLGTNGCGDRDQNHARACDRTAASSERADDPVYKITLLGNLFEWVGQRQPRVFGRVYLDAVNNVFAFRPFDRGNGSSGSTYAIFASNGAQVWARNNLFVGIPNAGHRALGLTTTSTPGQTPPKGEFDGMIRAEANLAARDEIIADNLPQQVARIDYGPAAAITPIEFHTLGAQDAIACVMIRAGAAGLANWPSVCQRKAN